MNARCAGLIPWVFSGMISGVQADQRSNVVLFVADDVSWNDYGCDDNSAARPPRIDALAEDGIRSIGHP